MTERPMKMELYQELVKHLNQLVLCYRSLLDTVRTEKQILMIVDLPALAVNNKVKEQYLRQIKDLENEWMSVAAKLYVLFGITLDEPRLSEIARYFTGEEQNKILQMQSLLNLLIQRTATVNKENEELIRSALTHINGAMSSIRATLSKNSTYAKKGKKNETPVETSGRLVSKEV
jgi:hypothetical protein